MAGNTLVEIALIFVLILANGYFAASELAIVSARKSRLAQKAEDGDRGAAAALELAENPNRFLSTVQIGITLIGTFAAAFGGASLAGAIEALLATTPALAPYAAPLGLGIVTICIAYISLIVGELVPKRLALQNAEQLAGSVAPVMRVVSRVAAPVVWFLTASTELVLRLLGRHRVAEQPITEDDILALVHEGAQSGTVDATERELIASVFTLTDRTVRSVMTPRTQITSLSVTASQEQVLRTVVESGYSRIPVYEGSPDTVIGLLYAKDLLRAREEQGSFDLRHLLRPATFVAEGQKAITVFQQMKQGHSALALVLDEYGQVAGLITLEDVLEELVGDISDEYDEAGEQLVRRDDGSYLVDGLLQVDELAERLNIPKAGELARREQVDTVGGLVVALFGHIPRAGSQLTWEDWHLEVVDMDGQRVDKVLVTPAPRNGPAQSEQLLAGNALRAGLAQGSEPPAR